MRSRAGKVRQKTPPEVLKAAGILLEATALSGRLDLRALFGNAHLVEIEVGPGKGAFLLRRAHQRPEINMLGIEWVRAYAAYAADRSYRAGLKNVRLLCADAAEVFRRNLPAQAAWRVHIYFPDPWPKRKHARRRLITASFLRQVQRAMKPGGWLGIVTDHVGYMRQIREALAQVSALAPVPFKPDPIFGDTLGNSTFGRKYVSAGKPIYALAALRY